MNQAQALTKLRRLYGPALAYRLDPRAPDAAQRDEMRAKWPAAKKAADAAEAARKARLEQLLTDPQYQALKANAQETAAAADEARAGMLHYRITVGTAGPVFFSGIM